MASLYTSWRKTMRFTLFLILFSTLANSAKSQENSIIEEWNDVLLESIRNDFARPTRHARNLYHSSVLMYDIWAIYNGNAESYFLGKQVGNFFCPFEGIPAPGETDAAIQEAVSYAMYRFIRYRFINAPGVPEIFFLTDQKMAELGYNTAVTSTDYLDGNPAHFGNYIAARMIEFGLQDGSNEANGFANTFYTPANQPLDMGSTGNPNMTIPDRWQQLIIEGALDQAGNPVNSLLPFLSPEWGEVVPFALDQDDLTIYQRDGFDWKVYVDPGAPPALMQGSGLGLEDMWKWGHVMVIMWQALHDPADGVMIDASPASIGNNPPVPSDFNDYPDFYDFFNGGDSSQGHAINPATGQPYETQMVHRADYVRVLAEFWADGPESETPPGHWFTILHKVNEHPMLEKRWNGQGEILSDLEWDAKTHFVLGCAMHDAAVAAWSVKGYYDTARPVSAIRYMAERGQCSDIGLPNYHPDGLPLIPGYIELVGDGDPLAGDANEHLNEVKLYTWRGHAYVEDTEVDIAGVDWILAKDWWPYQRPTFVSPPFAGYVSGHSTYSRTAAEVMELMTGSAYFPGGMSNFLAPQNEFLEFEEGPTEDIFLQWATYRDASDQCSLSRIFGGIHPPADDIPGRFMGSHIGPKVFNKAVSYFASLTPRVVEVTPSINTINDSHVGETITVEIIFDRPMDTELAPLVNFPIDDPLENSLSVIGGMWTSSTVYSLTFVIADANEELGNIFIQISDARDPLDVVQTPFIDANSFFIDTRNPSVTLASPDVNLINDDATASGAWLVSIQFDEAMDTNLDPVITFTGENPSNTLNYEDAQSGWSGNSTFIAAFSLNDADEEIASVNFEITQAYDAAGNLLVNYIQTNAASIDTRNPIPSEINFTADLITDANVGQGDFSIEVIFDEIMNPAITPQLSFANDNPVGTSLIFDANGSAWSNNFTTYTFAYSVADVNADLENITVAAVMGEDMAGNIQVSAEVSNAFDIDTRNPELNEYVLNDEMVSDSNVGSSNIQLVLIFDEAMNQNDPPVVTFSNPQAQNTLVYNTIESEWIDDVSFMAVFDVIDLNVELSNIGISVSNATDAVGNAQANIAISTAFDIDTKNPSPLVVTATDYVVDDTNIGAENFALIAIFDEAMNPSAAPFFLFPAENPLSVITPNSAESGWLNSTTYQAVYNVNDVVLTLNNIDVVLTGSVDLAGNLLVQTSYVDFFDISITGVRVEERELANLNIYPNPVTAGQLVRIRPQGEKINEVQIISANGALIALNQSQHQQNEVITIETANLSSGIYLIRLLGDKQVSTTRLQVID
jgi:hypothetical protein